MGEFPPVPVRIVTLPGDGIGPEIMAAARELLAALGDFELHDHLEGGAAIDGARAGAGPELARRAASSLRAVLGPPPLPAAPELERASRMWSMRRKALGSRPDGHG